MGKSTTSYVCQSCGSVYPKWAGKCEGCGEWNSLSEEVREASIPKGMNSTRKGKNIGFVPLKPDANKTKIPRHVTGLNEFDRVTGGGLVNGSAILIGGDPGIGKSTLLLQVVCKLALAGKKCVYVSGEESTDQVSLRAERLGLADAPVDLAAATSVRDIVATMEDASNPMDLIVIDSIQTMYVDNVESAPGTVTQVRTSAQELVRVAKKRGICILFVGHVTKDGQIAGPRVLEHIVDAVLYFEGDRGHQFRILRTVKNRFGPTDEIGVFEMAQEGLVEVANPSELFLAQRQENIAGSAVLAGLEGTRPVLVEVQALVAPSGLGNPRRAVIGWDSNRLAMVLAVLESRCGMTFSDCDIFLNIAGGIRISEPAADLAVAAALISSHTGQALPRHCVFFGEVGLSGEIRGVAQPDLRIKEAAKLGFEQAIMPAPQKAQKSGKFPLNVDQVDHLSELVTRFSGARRAA
ncbi:MAG: DNA repair protein RadA [Alphaproteobacteria bacterium]|nr:DNA repair protein RadA [Alphaproteobacteria bacterium]NCQ88698.1 DNA repair protein RadA [Alphaproteobacteria bacterium]NCT08205.1 DNA repair protein RadA [Alphaproteobacteria bacterium]